MSAFSCHVYYDHPDQNGLSIGLLPCTSHLAAITFCQVSPNPRVSLIAGLENGMERWNGKWNGTVNVHNYS